MKLFPYQETGARFLASKKRAGLLDGCRCGKTIQAVAAADYVGVRSILVICPGMARSVWERTFREASPLGRPVKVVWKSDDPIEPNGVTIISMDGTRNAEVFAKLIKHTWGVLIVDEQHFLKNRASQRTQQVLGRRGIASKARRIWFLTATPVMKDPSDTWTMLRTIGAYRGQFEEFLNEFCVWYPGEYGPVVKQVKNVERLRSIMAPHTMRRHWDEVKHEVTATPTPDPVYEVVKLQTEWEPGHEWFDQVSKLSESALTSAAVKKFVETGELRTGPHDPIPKVRNFIGLIKARPLYMWLHPKLDLYEWDKVVIFYHHLLCGKMLKEYLTGYKAKIIQGGTPAKKRDTILKGFWSNHRRRVLLCQDTIARQAIDLSVANRLVFAEMDWIPDNNYQASMRIQGPLQKRTPHIYTTVLEGTVDDVVTRACENRMRMSAQILT